jgi:hypothetical protein
LFFESTIDGLSQTPVQCQPVKTARFGASVDLAMAPDKEPLPKILTCFAGHF